MDPKLLKSIHNMFKARNYDLNSIKKDKKLKSYNEIINKDSQRNEKLIFIFIKTSKANNTSSTIRDVCTLSLIKNINHIIIVSNKPFDTHIKKYVDLFHNNTRIELFNQLFFQNNFIQRSNIKYSLLNDEEVCNMIKTMGKKIEIIKSTDPMVRYFDYKKNSILRIFNSIYQSYSFRIVK